jgi:hypothetical protein
MSQLPIQTILHPLPNCNFTFPTTLSQIIIWIREPFDPDVLFHSL